MTSTEKLYQIYQKHPLICTDTRKITPGSLFFALKGDKFDANAFAGQAIASGAAYAIIDNPDYRKGEQYILTDDVLLALQDLARHHRNELGIPVIGLTGTNGKTTTKELINAVLSQRLNTYATEGNLNNHIGVPLSILSIGPSHEAAVIEMGANHQKEIELLCSICRPSHGLITNVGKAHLEGFGGVEGVKKGKGELYDYLEASGGIAFVNSDSDDLMAMQHARSLNHVICYGSNHQGNLVSARLTENSPFVSLEWTDNSRGAAYQVSTQLTGAYNLDNILAAIALGVYFQLSPQQINLGISAYQPRNNRSQVTKTASNTLICDYYNANPSSMAVAIENVGKIIAKHKVLVLGDMFELGPESAAEHDAVIKIAMETPADERIFIGKEFAALGALGAGKGSRFYPSAEQAIAGLKTSPVRNATVLIKGSRGMALERLVELF